VRAQPVRAWALRLDRREIRDDGCVASRRGWRERWLELSLYKILFRCKALLGESIILLVPPPNCKAYPIAILLHDHWAIYALLPTPSLCMP